MAKCDSVRYFQCSKSIWKENPISGHCWPEEKLLDRWEVHSSYTPVSFHASEKAAIKECEMRIHMAKKFPYTPPK